MTKENKMKNEIQTETQKQLCDRIRCSCGSQKEYLSTTFKIKLRRKDF